MKWIFRFFAWMGFVFTLILVALAYLFITDPFGLKPLFMGGGHTSGLTVENTTTDTKESAGGTTNSTTETETKDTAGGLSPSQASALKSVGLDAGSLPTAISPEQESCFVGILGEARVLEIKVGSIPTPIEFYKAKACINL